MSSLLRSLRRPSALSFLRRPFATVVETSSLPDTPEVPVASSSTSTTSSAIAISPRARLPFHVDQVEKPARPTEIDMSAVTGQWGPYTQRTGVIARKRGMMALWDENGRRWPVTVLQLDNCQVIRHDPPTEHTTLHELQIGSSDRPDKTTPKSLRGHFQRAGTPNKYKMYSFRVTPDALLPVGTEITAAHYVPGQYVDVIANSIGKGFQGVMKRHGFRGGPASHGSTKHHRKGGSYGQHQDPGRIIPGRKMPGRMGGTRTTTHNLLVHKIDLALNLVYVRGAVPGFDDAFIRVRDAKKKVTYKAQAAFIRGKDKEEWLGEGVNGLPCPAGTREMAQGWPDVLEWPGPQARVVEGKKK
ncbi:translation protein [Naematelia encephala]|uniref:Large ribosomal subunit protein uL3m n=1 Tax=Naematelia encephala TaxID=71784 RepID=A0A1Y2BJM7_9TREE|nr:translation protein [Naematelia encephala]